MLTLGDRVFLAAAFIALLAVGFLLDERVLPWIWRHRIPIAFIGVPLMAFLFASFVR